jgi:hypothetical protein
LAKAASRAGCVIASLEFVSSSFRKPRSGYPESITTIVSEIRSASELGAAAAVIMDSGFALSRAPE